MANPRQRRKSRSASHKPVSHSRHAKRNLKKTPPIRAPKVLQEAWDKRKTVKQNYTTLGLVHSLNPSAPGGSESSPQHHSQDDSNTSVVQIHPLITSTTSAPPPPPKGYGRIIRDEVGNVKSVQLEEDLDCQTREQMTMKNIEPEVEQVIIERWAIGLGGKADKGDKAKSLHEELDSLAVVKHLSSTTLAVPQSRFGANARHSSTGEMTYLRRLIEKYGEDVERMAKDRKLNTDQRTEGQLRRALRNATLQSVNCS